MAERPARRAVVLPRAGRHQALQRIDTATIAPEPEDLSDLIGVIYDAALEPARWPDTLKAVSRFVPGVATALYSKDIRAASGGIYYDDGGMEPQHKQLYFEKFIKYDPFNGAHVFGEIEQPASLADWMPPAEYYKTRIHRELWQPQGIVDCINVVLDKSSTGAAMLGIFRHERHGMADDDALRRVRLIAPHVRRAALIGKAIELKSAEAATLADTLDGIAAGMLLVDDKGRLTHANAAGHAMLASGDVLSGSGGRVVPYDAQASQALADILSSAGSDRMIGVKGVALPMTGRSDERYVMHVLPLTSGARRRAGASYSASAALFVCKATLETRSPLEVVARSFSLTPTELRVLLAVVELSGVAEVADALGIAETTVKFHLRSLFEKTGTHRQAELVKLLASYSTPLAS